MSLKQIIVNIKYRNHPSLLAIKEIVKVVQFLLLTILQKRMP